MSESKLLNRSNDETSTDQPILTDFKTKSILLLGVVVYIIMLLLLLIFPHDFVPNLNFISKL